MLTSTEATVTKDVSAAEAGACLPDDTPLFVMGDGGFGQMEGAEKVLLPKDDDFGDEPVPLALSASPTAQALGALWDSQI